MQSGRKTVTLLTWSLLAVIGTFLLLAGALLFWNAIAGWFTPVPPGVTPAPVVSAATRTPSASPTPAATRTPAPDIFIPSPTAFPTLVYFQPQSLPSYINPLTGLRVDDPSLLERRPIAVKVTNFPRYVRQWQSGLSLADIVFEYYLEEGLTRFITVFYGNDAPRVGPVRSARFFDEHVVRMYHAIFVFASADDRLKEYLFKTDIKKYLITPNDFDCPPLCRDDKISDYNNVFLDTSKMAAYLAWLGTDNSRPALNNTYYFSFIPPSNLSADRVYTHYSDYDYNYWEYDPSRQQYLRYQETSDVANGQSPAYAPHTDNLTGRQLTTDNVIVLFVRHIHNPQSSGEMYVFDLFGEGQAFVFRDGQAYPASWVRMAMDQPLDFVD